MPVREAIAAGRFYSGQAEGLTREVENYLKSQKITHKEKPWAYMLPHAGYIYSGAVAGETLAGMELENRIIILCPNHTGRGAMLGVWPGGEWKTPLGSVQVDSVLAEELIGSGGGYSPDAMSHFAEHSIEVLLPFIQICNPHARIVPVCVGTRNAQALARAGKALAKVLKDPANKNVSLVISSDMNHYENEKLTLKKDEMAIAQALAANPEALLQVTELNNISMCGAAPLALALFAARDLGGVEAELVAHATSGPASGDYEHVVGYAGMRFYLK